MDQRLVRETQETNNGGEVATQKSKLPYLPDDIIIEILLRSPVRSIGRFSCLSKLFCSLLSNLKFTRKQLELTLQRSNVVSSNNLRLITSFRKLFLVDIDSIRVEREYPLKKDLIILTELYDRCCIGSSNGLVCLRGKCAFNEKDEEILLYNPTTREFKRVPELHESLRCKRVREYRSYSSYGFGFDALTNDYKVVMLVSCNDDEHKNTVCYVYSLKIDSWRMITNLLPYYDEIDVSSAKIKGAIHWIARIYDEGGEDQKLLMAFDLEKEELREMPLPDWPVEFEGGFGSLGVDTIKGCLSVVHYCFKMHNVIWMMNEYGLKSSWSKIKIDNSDYSMKPLCLAKHDEEVLPLLDSHLLYTKLKYLRNELYIKMKAHTYVESLISPNSYAQHR